MISELWTVRRTAAYLGVTTKRVYWLIAKGRLVSLKLSPRVTRVTRESVDALLVEQIRRTRRELGLDIAPVSGRRRAGSP
jgi:hypothetical protein